MENIKTQITTNESSANEDSAVVALSVIGGAAALVGIWGVVCLVSGVAQYGLFGMIKGWLSSVGIL